MEHKKTDGMDRYVLPGEVGDFCEALTRLTKEYGIVILGAGDELNLASIDEHEMSEFDYYAPVDENHLFIKFDFHKQKADE